MKAERNKMMKPTQDAEPAKCPICRGTGEIQNGKGEWEVCYVCKGSGLIEPKRGTYATK